jgi:hypothetical protein
VCYRYTIPLLLKSLQGEQESNLHCVSRIEVTLLFATVKVFIKIGKVPNDNKSNETRNRREAKPMHVFSDSVYPILFYEEIESFHCAANIHTFCVYPNLFLSFFRFPPAPIRHHLPRYHHHFAHCNEVRRCKRVSNDPF